MRKLLKSAAISSPSSLPAVKSIGVPATEAISPDGMSSSLPGSHREQSSFSL